MKSWYSFKNKAGGVLDISLHDEIGAWGVTAAEFMAELDAHPDVTAINLSIHSPGGSVFDGLAMYNKLRAHPAMVYGKIEGIAASAASFVFLASDVREMPENAWIMIHNEMAGVVGSAEDMEETAELLYRIRQMIVNIYGKHTNLSEDEIVAMMAEETWLSGEQAKDAGFVDTLSDRVEVAAKASQFAKYFKDLPVSNNAEVSDINSVKDFERYLRDVCGVSKGLATALTSRLKVVTQGDPVPPPDDSKQLLARLERFKVPDKLKS